MNTHMDLIDAKRAQAAIDKYSTELRFIKDEIWLQYQRFCVHGWRPNWWQKLLGIGCHRAFRSFSMRTQNPAETMDQYTLMVAWLDSHGAFTRTPMLNQFLHKKMHPMRMLSIWRWDETIHKMQFSIDIGRDSRILVDDKELRFMLIWGGDL